MLQNFESLHKKTEVIGYWKSKPRLSNQLTSHYQTSVKHQTYKTCAINFMKGAQTSALDSFIPFHSS